MTLTIEHLKQQLKDSQADVENSRVMLHRAEGMVLLLSHLIAYAEQPEEAEAPPATADVAAARDE